jgi:alpha-maltose-1-phosphate synthase
MKIRKKNKDIKNIVSRKKIFLLSLLGRGGTYHTTVQISSSIAEHCDTYALIPSYSDTRQISKKVHLIKISAPPNIFKTLLLSFNISQHIKTIKTINATKPDIINFLDAHPWYLIYWPFLKAQKKVVTINDPEMHAGEVGYVETRIWTWITKFLLRHAEEIIVLAKKQAETVRKLGYKQKIIISRIGNYGFLAKKTHNIKTEPKTILFFGRIRDYKGLNYLLDALIELKEDFKLVIAGDGDLTPYNHQLEKLKGKVEIYNKFIDDDSIAPFFERSAFVVLPYIEATQTGIIPVAYSFKKAVIATDVGSIPEFVINNHTGIIIHSRDVIALRKAIKTLLHNPTKAKNLGLNGYKFMKKELNWNIITKKLLKELFS